MVFFFLFKSSPAITVAQISFWGLGSTAHTDMERLLLAFAILCLSLATPFFIHCGGGGASAAGAGAEQSTAGGQRKMKMVSGMDAFTTPDDTYNYVGSPFTLPPPYDDVMGSPSPSSPPHRNNPVYCVYPSPPPPPPRPPQPPATASPPPPTTSLPSPPPPPRPAAPTPPSPCPIIVNPTPSTPPNHEFPTPPQFVPGPPVFQPPIVYPPPSVPPPPSSPGTNYRRLWCVAKPSVPDPIIQEAMNYACGSGADCDSIQPNGSCYEPNTLIAHASFAFNSYWQRTKVVGGTCDFGGTAMLVTGDPSFDGCHFQRA